MDWVFGNDFYQDKPSSKGFARRRPRVRGKISKAFPLPDLAFLFGVAFCAMALALSGRLLP
jgi:hypothetical protein